MKFLAIGLSSWILSDGNYSDFRRGDTAAFALEFYAPEGLEEIALEDNPERSVTHVEGPYYEISGKCVHLDIDGSQSWWVLDVGLMLYWHELPPLTAHTGSWWRGRIYLGVDHFFYMDRGSRHHEAPALIYDWKVYKIEAQDASADSGWVEMDQTRLGRHSEYLLYCTRQEGSPRR